MWCEIKFVLSTPKPVWQMQIETGSKSNHLARWFDAHWTGLMIKWRRYHLKNGWIKDMHKLVCVAQDIHTTQRPIKVLFLVRRILLNAIQHYIRTYQFTLTDAFLIQWAHFCALLFGFFLMNFSDYFAFPSLNFMATKYHLPLQPYNTLA